MTWTGRQAGSPKKVLCILDPSPLFSTEGFDLRQLETTRLEWGEATFTERDETTKTGQWDKTTRTGQFDETTRTGLDETSWTGQGETTRTGQYGAGWDVDDMARQDDGKKLEKNDPICENNGPEMLWWTSPWKIPDSLTIKNPPHESRVNGRALGTS